MRENIIIARDQFSNRVAAGRQYKDITNRLTPAMAIKSILAEVKINAPFLFEYFKNKQKELVDDPAVEPKERQRRLIALLGFVDPQFYSRKLPLPQELRYSESLGSSYTFADLEIDNWESFYTWHQNFEIHRESCFTAEELGLYADQTDNPRHPQWAERAEIESDFSECFLAELEKLFVQKAEDLKAVLERNKSLMALVSQVEHFPFFIRNELSKRIDDFGKKYKAINDPGIEFALNSLAELVEGEVKVRTSKRLLEALIDSYWEALISQLRGKEVKETLEMLRAEITSLTNKINYQKEN